MVVGVAATGVAIAAEAAVMAGVMAYGVASTGTAISTLSGAAAMNAALAWCGGGAAAAGGFGVTGGLVALSAGGLVVAAVATYAIYVAWDAYESHRQGLDWAGMLRAFSGREGELLRDSPAWYRGKVGEPLPK